MVNVKAHTRKTKQGLVRIKAHRRACSEKRYAVYGKVKGQKRGILFGVDASGRSVPMVFNTKDDAIKTGEIWKRMLAEKRIKAKYTIGSGTKEDKQWREDTMAVTALRRLQMKVR